MSNKFIIDVGTSHNAPRGLALKKEYNCPVIFIEPDSNALEKVPADENDIKINAAITSYDGEIEFNYYQDGTHSVLKTNIEEIHNYIDGYTGSYATIENWSAKKTEKVLCYRLSTLFEKLNISKVVYLKIDTQGHDLEVIKSLGNYLSLVDHIECEVQVTNFEIYKNQSKKNDIISFLTQNNFVLDKIESQTFNQEENLFFTRKNI